MTPTALTHARHLIGRNRLPEAVETLCAGLPDADYHDAQTIQAAVGLLGIKRGDLAMAVLDAHRWAWGEAVGVSGVGWALSMGAADAPKPLATRARGRGDADNSNSGTTGAAP